MSSTRITQTARATLQPVDTRLVGQFEALVDLIRRRVGPAHAALFAEPVRMSGDTGAIAWFAPEDGEVSAVEALASEAAASLHSEAERLIGELRSFADRLDGEGPASREAARLLRDALVVPDEGALWSVDGRPVLIGWGHRSAGTHSAAPARAFVTAVGAAAPASPAATPPPGDTPRTPKPGHPAPMPASGWSVTWLPVGAALLAALCLFLLVYRLMTACAVGDGLSFLRPILSDICPAPAASAAAVASLTALDADVKRRERELMGRARSCAAARPTPAQRRAETPLPFVATAPIPAPADAPERRLESVRRGRIFEVTLLWEGPSDLDLHIQCPGGERIGFNSRAACGGLLAADLNAEGGSSEARPIEHIIWDRQPSPDGTFGVGVNLFGRHGDARPRIPFRVILWRDGQQIRQENGDLATPGTYAPVLTFTSPLEP